MLVVSHIFMNDSEEELICLAGGLPLRGCVCAGGLMLQKQITNRVKGAE